MWWAGRFDKHSQLSYPRTSQDRKDKKDKKIRKDNEDIIIGISAIGKHIVIKKKS